jgi:hypothetical protein
MARGFNIIPFDSNLEKEEVKRLKTTKSLV